MLAKSASTSRHVTPQIGAVGYVWLVQPHIHTTGSCQLWAVRLTASFSICWARKIMSDEKQKCRDKMRLSVYGKDVNVIEAFSSSF
jgi:hypothetical protein